MIITIGKKYHVTDVDGRGTSADVLVTDAAHNTSNGVTGFLCELIGNGGHRMVYPPDFDREIR